MNQDWRLFISLTQNTEVICDKRDLVFISFVKKTVLAICILI